MEVLSSNRSDRRLEILWNEPAPYLLAAASELSYHCQVTLVFSGHNRVDSSSFHKTAQVTCEQEFFRRSHLRDYPDVLMISGWKHVSYLKRAFKARGNAKRVLVMDNQWRRTPKQRVAQIIFFVFRRLFFDFAFVPGERQADFAKKLGFKQEEVFQGSYACDPKVFRRTFSQQRTHAVLLVARLEEEKGIRTLVNAYLEHRKASARPLGLTVVGAGSLGDALRGLPGVNMLGKLGPAGVAAQMKKHKALILPSSFEPWGVVLHEAASTGLPIICTTECGASDEFVSQESGWKIKSRDVTALAEALGELANSDDASIEARSLRSLRLASRISQSQWISTVLDFSREDDPPSKLT